jgi:hypothetical protein
MARTLEEEEEEAEEEEEDEQWSFQPDQPYDYQPDKPQHRQEPEPDQQEGIRTSDREELIQCIKRGQRPTWVPKPNLEALCAETNAQAAAESACTAQKTPKSISQGLQEATRQPPQSEDVTTIARPPSALHTGDFYTSSSSRRRTSAASFTPPAGVATQTVFGSPFAPWLHDGPPARFHRAASDNQRSDSAAAIRPRSRAPSLGSSLSSSFVMRVPTSPLVHATSSPESEPADDRLPTDDDFFATKPSRRRTLPSHTLSQMASMVSAPTTPVPTVMKEVSAPFRSHQVRRSLTSFTYQPVSSSQTVFPSRQRRLSQAFDTSPGHRSSMVGSFEESILRGRMSSPPSKPLDFVAQIGVLGKGNCPAKLKCPAHVSVPFPAVFYSYSHAVDARNLANDNPSPYVGTIDLATNLAPVELTPKKKRKALISSSETPSSPSPASLGRKALNNDASSIGGAYRIPQQGQLQFIIKNPNKTAVKLFLIPYDLEGMAPGTKTFVRQRSFSSGPLLEKAISADPNKSIQDPLSEKQILRYLIHLRFCCPVKGKYYLYDKVKVVFANRVPEGKEKLRNEVQLPEPRFSPFAAINTVKRIESNDFEFTPGTPPFAGNHDAVDGLSQKSKTEQFFAADPIPFHLAKSTANLDMEGEIMSKALDSDTIPDQRHASSRPSGKTSRPQSPEVHGFDKASTSQRASPVPWPSLGQSISRTSSPTPAQNGNGLLSLKLREMSTKPPRS